MSKISTAKDLIVAVGIGYVVYKGIRFIEGIKNPFSNFFGGKDTTSTQSPSILKTRDDGTQYIDLTNTTDAELLKTRENLIKHLNSELFKQQTQAIIDKMNAQNTYIDSAGNKILEFKSNGQTAGIILEDNTIPQSMKDKLKERVGYINRGEPIPENLKIAGVDTPAIKEKVKSSSVNQTMEQHQKSAKSKNKKVGDSYTSNVGGRKVTTKLLYRTKR